MFETLRALNLADLMVDLVLAIIVCTIAYLYYRQRVLTARRIKDIHRAITIMKQEMVYIQAQAKSKRKPDEPNVRVQSKSNPAN